MSNGRCWLDSQTVKAAETVGAAACGYDAGKKIKGQKRHIVVDTLGLLSCVLVTAASVQDRDGAHPLLALLREKYSTIALVRADGGYAGRLQAGPGRSSAWPSRSAGPTPCTRSPRCSRSTRCGPVTPSPRCCPRARSWGSGSCRSAR